jgi:hypothetical protein
LLSASGEALRIQFENWKFEGEYRDSRFETRRASDARPFCFIAIAIAIATGVAWEGVGTSFLLDKIVKVSYHGAAKGDP